MLQHTIKYTIFYACMHQNSNLNNKLFADMNVDYRTAEATGDDQPAIPGKSFWSSRKKFGHHVMINMYMHQFAEILKHTLILELC